MNNMNERQKWQELANRYLNAETSVEEDLELLEYYSKTKDSLTLEEEDVRTILVATTNFTAENILSEHKADEFDRLMEKKKMHIASSFHRITFFMEWIVSVAATVVIVWFIYAGRTNEETPNAPTDVANYKTDSISKMLNISMNLMTWGLLKSYSDKCKNKTQTVVAENNMDKISNEQVRSVAVSAESNLKRGRDPGAVLAKKRQMDRQTAFSDNNKGKKKGGHSYKYSEHKNMQTASQTLSKPGMSTDARSDSFSLEQQITDIITASNVQGEQVETYEIQRAGDANIVTRRMADGCVASYIIMTSDNNEEYHVVPINIEF